MLLIWIDMQVRTCLLEANNKIGELNHLYSHFAIGTGQYKATQW